MATRSTIKIEGVTFAKIYKHWDGSPSRMLPWLKEFNKKFTEERGNDSEYKFAQLLRFSEREKEKFNLDESTCTGWGVISYDSNWSEEYEYFLRLDGSVTYKQI